MKDERDKKDVLMTKKAKSGNNGARNIVVLGLISILIAVSTTGVSLAVYHGSGDIYLDRSRPGYLPDKAEIEEVEKQELDDDYSFEKSGKLSGEVLEEYLKELDEEVQAIDSFEKPFYEDVLSDENLGITQKSNAGSESSSSEEGGGEPQSENGA